MKKYIVEVNNYCANNPFIKREPLKHKFMRSSYIVYMKLRVMLSKWYPLSDWQKHLWMDNEELFLSEKDLNEGKVIIDSGIDKSIEPFFNIELLSAMELIPKEHINDLKIGISKLRKKHSNNVFDRYAGNADYFESFDDGSAYTSFGGFIIKEKSELKRYIDQISFKIINISDSFACLNVCLYINSDLKQNISSFAISHIPEQNIVTGFEGKRWYQIRQLGKGVNSGDVHKYKTLEMVITDVKWNVMNEISKFVKPMIFHSQKLDTPSVSSIITNIDGNNNISFWRSINIDSRLCDFYNEMSACIAWRSYTNSPFFIYSKREKTGDLDIKNDIMSYHIGDELCSFQIASCVNSSIRMKLKKHSLDLAKLRKKNIRYWLKSNVKANTEMFYEARFISEYKYVNEDAYFSDFINLMYDKSIISRLHNNIEKQIQSTKKLYEDINKLYQSNIDYPELFMKL